MLRKVIIFSIVVGFLLSSIACNVSSKITTESQALSQVKDHQKGKTSSMGLPSHENENCLKYVNRQNSINYWYAVWIAPDRGWKGRWRVGAKIHLGGYNHWNVYEDGKVNSDQIITGC